MTRTQRRIEEFRKGNAVIQVKNASGHVWPGVPVSIEQESHAFPFGCVVPELHEMSEPDRARYRTRLDDLFNDIILVGQSPQPGRPFLRVELNERTHLSRLLSSLDDLAQSGLPLQVHVWGKAIGLTGLEESGSVIEREAGRRAAEIHTLCFSHPAVSGIYWNGFRDGETDARGGGLLRRDLSPRYAYHALRKLIGFEWHTRAAGLSDLEGRFRFRGFFGDYRLVANAGTGTPIVQSMMLSRPVVPTQVGQQFAGQPE